MRGKKWFLMAGMLVSFALTIGGQAKAESGGAYCSGVEVVYAGAASSGNIIAARHTRTDCGSWGANTIRWFTLHTSNDDAMLATVLTAQTSKTKLVLVPAVAGTFTDWSVITQLYTGN